MKKFALLEPTTITVVGLNVRSEKHGKTKVPAVDIRCQLKAANTLLDQLKGPELRQALYLAVKDGEVVAEPELDGVEPITDTPLLRVNGLDPIHLQDELTGYTVTFDLGTGRKESIVELVGCKVNAFVIEAMQGGSVKIGFRIQASHVGKRDIGEIGVLIDCEASIKLEPPLVTEPIDGTVTPIRQGRAA